MSHLITKARANRWGSIKSAEVYNKTNNRCGYCGSKVHDNGSSIDEPKMATFDHIIPLSKGGTKDLKNVILACRECNALKGNSELDFLRMKLLIKSGRMPKFNEVQFQFLYNRGINLGKLLKYDFYFEKQGLK